MLLARLNNASVEPNARCSHRPKRGTIRERSGVIGFVVKRNPTWSTLPADGHDEHDHEQRQRDAHQVAQEHRGPPRPSSAFGLVAFDRNQVSMASIVRSIERREQRRARGCPPAASARRSPRTLLATLPSSRALRSLCSDGSSVRPSSSAANHCRCTSNARRERRRAARATAASAWIAHGAALPRAPTSPATPSMPASMTRSKAPIRNGSAGDHHQERHADGQREPHHQDVHLRRGLREQAHGDRDQRAGCRGSGTRCVRALWNMPARPRTSVCTIMPLPATRSTARSDSNDRPTPTARNLPGARGD